MSKYLIPDKEYSYLQSLYKVVAAMEEDYTLPPSAPYNEPESHLFTSEDIEVPEDLESIRLVGSRDLSAKILYWEEIIWQVNQQDSPHIYTEEDYRDARNDYLMERAERQAGC